MTTDTRKRFFVNRVLRIPDGESFIYWLTRKQDVWYWQLIGFLVFSLLFYIVLGGIEATIAMLLAIILHEVGHYIVFRRNRIETKIRFLLPIGAVAIPETEEENIKSDLLPWWNIGWLLLAGVSVNALLMLIGKGLMLFVPVLASFGETLLFYNSLLIFFNLLPVWKTDGGQFFFVIFSSLEEKIDKTISSAVSFGVLIIIAAICLFGFSMGGVQFLIGSLIRNFVFIVILLVSAIGIRNIQNNDDHLMSKSSQAMTVSQACIQIVAYMILMIITFLLI